MIKVLLVVIPAFFLLCVLVIGAYLSPNDLAGCGEQPTEEGMCRKADAIIAVSGGKTTVRTAEAIALYKKGWADYLIFSGAAKDADSPSNAEVMRDQALREGVPSTAILLDEEARTTHQNARQTDMILQRHNISTIILVTSPYHQRRAGLEFARNTASTVEVRNHPATNDPDWQWYWWLTPRGWWLAVGELVKITATHAGGSE